MKRMGILLGCLALVLVVLAGCSLVPSVSSVLSVDGSSPSLTVRGNGTGWATATVSGVSAEAYRLHFGDSYEAWSYVAVAGSGTFAHFYARPGVYAVRLLAANADALPIAQAVLEVPVCDYYFEIIEVNGRVITFSCYGLAGVFYEFNSGDGRAEILKGDDRLPVIVRHIYEADGTYSTWLRRLGDVGGGLSMGSFERTITVGAGL